MSAPAPLTASIDLGFLNTIVAEAVSTAALRVHLASSDDPNDQRTVVSWSAPVANLMGGKIEYRAQVSPGTEVGLTWELNLNSNPASPVINIETVNGAPVLTATLDFVPAPLTGVVDIGLTEFEIVATVNFDGTYKVVANVGTSTQPDPSGIISSDVESQINAKLASAGITSAKIKSVIDSFFVSLLRLSSASVFGHIQQYAVQGNALVVSYNQSELMTIDTGALDNFLHDQNQGNTGQVLHAASGDLEQALQASSENPK